MSIVEAANRVAREHYVLSNTYRTITLGYLIAKQRGSWSDIKRYLETQLGPVNPNTLHFHLKTLIENRFIIPTGDPEKPVYQIGELPSEVRESLSSIAKLIEAA